ncbi:MAG: CBS domain-containing protein [Calditrichaeota bacterium]|nr:CBS domain-containing protein [Calditrichota bacterium]MCB9066359.1 CBS domain-containing protein [Calditrichia bacterium]
MGKLNVKEAVQSLELQAFMRSLLEDLRTLDEMIKSGAIESDITRIGAEQELCMIDEFWRPAPVIESVLPRIRDPHFTTELAKFNLEFNLDPMEFNGDCLSKLETEIHAALAKACKAVRMMRGDVILCGILPTIRNMDLELDNMTPIPRYKALFNSLRRMRGGPFEYHILGKDELIFKQDYPSFEFCNTSFQIHYQVSPAQFIDTYNFSKLITAPVLAVATNSPLLFGKRLWHETRIALFQQAIDTRNMSHHLRKGRSRVSFSDQWVRNSILEIFQDDVSRFRLLLYADVEEKSWDIFKNGEIPELTALRIFNGTIYRWNRACYGILDGKPHLRIENRVLPAGPTVVDEVANAAFWFGLMHGMPDEYRNLPNKIEFDLAVENFTNAARNGLDASFYWINDTRYTAQDLVLKELLPIAKNGLKRANIDAVDSEKYLSIIQERVESGNTGSRWMLRSFTNLKEKGYGDESLVALTAGIVKRQKTNTPVHKWDLATIDEAGSWINKFGRVEQIMANDLFTVQQTDLVDLVTSIMDWKDVRHIPVEGDNGELVGLITSRSIIHHYVCANEGRKNAAICAGDIMIRNPITASPEMFTVDAVLMMQKHEIGCLPVVKSGRLVGIVTEYDFMKISAQLLDELYGKIDVPQNNKPPSKYRIKNSGSLMRR